jgi:hypothetical protein
LDPGFRMFDTYSSILRAVCKGVQSLCKPSAII